MRLREESRILSRVVGLAGVLLLAAVLVCGPLHGCAPDSRAIDEAYERGYGDGLAAAQDEQASVEEAYELGYEDGLQAAEEQQMTEVCQSCYGVGFNEGYQYGYADGSAGREPAELDEE